MSDSFRNITEKVNKLNRLLENSKDKKILWEEMKLLSDKAFDLQDELMAELEDLEAREQDIVKLQAVFDTREMVWDLIAQIAKREAETKEKATKNHKNAHEKCSCDCGCHHEEKNCECGCHHHEEHHCKCEHSHEEHKCHKKCGSTLH